MTTTLLSRAISLTVILACFNRSSTPSIRRKYTLSKHRHQSSLALLWYYEHDK